MRDHKQSCQISKHISDALLTESSQVTGSVLNATLLYSDIPRREADQAAWVIVATLLIGSRFYNISWGYSESISDSRWWCTSSGHELWHSNMTWIAQSELLNKQRRNRGETSGNIVASCFGANILEGASLRPLALHPNHYKDSHSEHDRNCFWRRSFHHILHACRSHPNRYLPT